MNEEVFSQTKGPFLTDIEEIRRRAREHIEKGAVTPGHKGDLKTVLRALNEALATELVCVLRYKRHHYMAKGIHSQVVAEEFRRDITRIGRHVGRTGLNARGHLRGCHLLSDPGQGALAFGSHP